MARIEDVPSITVDIEKLKAAGFVDSGTGHFIRAVSEYAQELFRRSVTYADFDRRDTGITEVTFTHVRRAAEHLAVRARPSSWPKLRVTGQVFEYVLTASTAICARQMFQTTLNAWWVVGFGLSLAVGLLLLVIRLTTNMKDS